MLLAVDIGNTTIQFGLWDGSCWQRIWRAHTDAAKLPDEYVVLIRQLFISAGLPINSIQNVVLSSVVPALSENFRQVLKQMFLVDPLVIRHNLPGIRVKIDQPEQAGADRLVNAAAAHALYGGPAIVIDFGTATNFDVVSEHGEYIGGAIAPGMQIAHDALVRMAARLHKVEIVPPPRVIGSNTVHAMQSGIFWGYVSLIEGMVRRLGAELTEASGLQPKVIASGGYAELLAQHLPDLVDEVAPNLLLDGLRVIHSYNCNG